MSLQQGCSVLETIEVLSAETENRRVLNKDYEELYDNYEELIDKKDPISERQV